MYLKRLLNTTRFAWCLNAMKILSNVYCCAILIIVLLKDSFQMFWVSEEFILWQTLVDGYKFKTHTNINRRYMIDMLPIRKGKKRHVKIHTSQVVKGRLKQNFVLSAFILKWPHISKIFSENLEDQCKF